MSQDNKRTVEDNKRIVGYMLTTIDNPFDPVTQYDAWMFYDERILGYCTNAYLGRVAKLAPNLTALEVLNETSRAMDDIIRLNGPNFYKKVPIYA